MATRQVISGSDVASYVNPYASSSSLKWYPPDEEIRINEDTAYGQHFEERIRQFALEFLDKEK
jgi:hypothetical protein